MKLVGEIGIWREIGEQKNGNNNLNVNRESKKEIGIKNK